MGQVAPWRSRPELLPRLGGRDWQGYCQAQRQAQASRNRRLGAAGADPTQLGLTAAGCHWPAAAERLPHRLRSLGAGANKPGVAAAISLLTSMPGATAS